jgi:hypothetical protein
MKKLKEHEVKLKPQHIWHSSTDYQLNNMKLTSLHHQKSAVLFISKRKKNAVLLSWVY